MNETNHRVLILADSPERASYLSELLETDGISGRICGGLGEALSEMLMGRVSAALVEWRSGEAWPLIAGALRERDPLLPVLAFAAREDAAALVALDAGADDFLPFPSEPRLVQARVRARIRQQERARGLLAKAGLENPTVLKAGRVELDTQAREVKVEGRKVTLSSLEYELLTYLMSNIGIAMSRAQILQDVYKVKGNIPTERVDLLVRRLRSKLGGGAEHGEMIVAVPGFGYRLERRRKDRDIV